MAAGKGGKKKRAVRCMWYEAEGDLCGEKTGNRREKQQREGAKWGRGRVITKYNAINVGKCHREAQGFGEVLKIFKEES